MLRVSRLWGLKNNGWVVEQNVGNLWTRINNNKWCPGLKAALSLFGVKEPLKTIIRKLDDRQFQRKYAHVAEFVLQVEGISIAYATDDFYSKRWFYPRYEGGKIHEEPVVRLLLDNLKQGMCFFDIGAFNGYYTVIASKIVGAKGSVYAFEMDEINYSILKKNLERNKCENVEARRTAVSDTSGQIEYVQITDSIRGAGHHIKSQLPTPEYRTVISVDCVSLDEFCSRANVVPDVVKIDVEGAELKVLNGMEATLTSEHIKLFLEVHPERLRHFGHSIDQVVERLHAFQMEVFEIVGMRKHGQRVTLRQVETADNITTNSMVYAYHRK